MSKVALQKVLDQIAEKQSGTTYRKKISDVQNHSIIITKDGVTRALKASFDNDPAYSDLITPDILSRASAYYYTVITAKMIRFRVPGTDEYIVTSGSTLSGKTINNPYNAIADRLNDSSVALLKFLEKLVGATPSNLKAGDLVNFDHTRTVSDTRIASYFSGAKSKNLLTLLRERDYVTQEEYTILTEIQSYYTSDGTKNFYIEASVVGDIRSGKENVQEGITVVNARNNRLRSSIQSALNSKSIDWAAQGGSDPKLTQIRKEIVSTAMKSIKKNKYVTFVPETINTTVDKSANTASKKIIVKEETSNTRDKIGSSSKGGKISKTATKTPSSYVSLMNILNEKLPEVIRGNMTGSRLHNRTGRFSESVRVTDITTTPDGYPSIEYTYARSPYDVFDPVLGTQPWATPDRDPKKLISLSIRDVAVSMAIGRFYTRRG